MKRPVAADPFRLDGRVALVTGAGGGLGEGICASLATAGAAVACVDRSEEKALARVEQLRSSGATAVAVVTDVSDEASVAAMARQVLGELGGIDIVVNNAGIYPSRPWLEVTVEEFDEVQATNVRGYFLCARACHESLASRGHGRIVNVSSITISGGWENLLAYVTSKGAVMAFTRALAREVGKEGITANCIAPGAFPTDAEKIHPDRENYVRTVLERQALKRRGAPDDVGHLVRFLASDASSFITGQLITIDGGWIMH